MGGTLPQWLIDPYKVNVFYRMLGKLLLLQRSDPGGLLSIYINYSQLGEALLLATDYINAALGSTTGTEFGMVCSNQKCCQ